MTAPPHTWDLPAGVRTLAPAVPVGGRRTRLRVRPVSVLLLALAASGLGNLGRLPFVYLLGRDSPIVVHELVLVVGVLLAGVACAQARALRVDAVAATALAFAAIGGGSAFAAAAEYALPVDELAYSLAYLARWLLYLGMYVALLNVARGGDADRVWRTVEGTALVVAVFGIAQSLLLPGFAQTIFPTDVETREWDVQGRRLVSTLLDPNYAGAVFLLPLLVHVGRLAYGVAVPAWRPLVLVAAVALTASRSTALGLIVGLAVIVVARGPRRALVRLGAGLAVLTLLASPLLVGFLAQYSKFSVDGSARLRVVSWLRALTVLADHPVFGVGFNTYGFVQRAYGWEIVGRDSFGLDGGVLFIAVMTGLVGASVYLLMLALVVRRCRRVWRDRAVPARGRGLALGVGAGVAALCVHSVFVNSLLLPFVMAPQMALWAAVFLYGRAARRPRGLA